MIGRAAATEPSTAANNFPRAQFALRNTLTPPKGTTMNTARFSTRTALVSLALLSAGLAGAATTSPQDAPSMQTVTVTGDPLASNVKAAILQAVGQKSPDITVANRDGFISLGGWARTGADVSRAMNVTLAVNGVKQVYNDGVRLWSSRMFDY
jgi:osmotically-inducible protein OsmY